MPAGYKLLPLILSRKMKRIFIALKVAPDKTFLGFISSLKDGLSNENIRWASPDNMHITLVFLGDTEEKKVKAIYSMLNLKCTGFGKFELLIKGSGVFRKWSDPRVIWAGIDLSDKLLQLRGLISEGLKNEGISFEDRPFKPHLTIGRIKYLKDKILLQSLIDNYKNAEIQKIPVNEVILYESILHHSGPEYKTLLKVDL
jgi:2'-5' RNA ligase